MAIGRTDYEERKEQKIENYERMADKATKEAVEQHQRAKDIADRIPFGQPILIGHHSEKKHRAAIKQIETGFRRSYEASEKADYYHERANKAAGNGSISGDDPNALELYQEELAGLEARQELMKKVNIYWRKHKTMKGFEGLSEEEAIKIDEEQKTALSYLQQNGPYGEWTLSNNNAKIRRVKFQIQKLELLDKMEEQKINFPGGCLFINTEINRVQFLFDTIPDEKVRKLLKSNGFKWSPSEKAWQRQRTLNAIRDAKYLIPRLSSI